MFKYMKYEIKGTYKFIFTLILTVIAASTGIQLYAYSAMKKLSDFSSMGNSMNNGFLIVLMILMIFGAFVTAFFYIVGSFRKELYEDRGYLTFSLPLTGNQILGSKLLIALFWSTLLGLSALLYNYILGAILFGSSWTGGFRYILSFISGDIGVTLGISSILSGILTLLLIYFSMTLSRVSVRNKKIGGLWFIIFLILNSLVSFFIIKAVNIFPYYMDFSTFKIINQTDISNIIRNNTTYFMSTGANQGLVIGVDGRIVANIGAFIISILIGIGTFFATSYLMERKIDL